MVRIIMVSFTYPMKTSHNLSGPDRPLFKKSPLIDSGTYHVWQGTYIQRVRTRALAHLVFVEALINTDLKRNNRTVR